MANNNIIDWIKTNEGLLECEFYRTMGQGAYAAAIGSIFTAQPYVVGGFALVGGAAELAWNLSDCGSIPPAPNIPIERIDGCSKVINGYGMLQDNAGPGGEWRDTAIMCDQIYSTGPVFQDGNVWNINVCVQDRTYDERRCYNIGFVTEELAWNARFRINPTRGQCAEYGGPEPPSHNPGEPIGEPYTVVQGDCTWTITPTDAYIDASGKWHTYYTVVADDQELCGGPFAYWTSDDGPDWKPGPVGPDPLPPKDAKCCKEILEYLERIEKCSCKDNEKPALAGDWVTTRWKSDETDDITGTRLRKRFRYRSKSSRNLKQLSDYWRDFTWQAGQVCVIHKGTWWGTPQVWASTAEEGKRVIRFAGAEAGIDPDQMGEWIVSGSRTPRYGMFGTMRLIDKEGFPWVASRDGADWPNYLAR